MKTKLRCLNCSKVWDEEDLPNANNVCGCGGELEEVEIMTEEDATESYNECLDEYGSVKIAGLDFYPSTVLRECDPIAYRCGLADFINSLDCLVEGYY